MTTFCDKSNFLIHYASMKEIATYTKWLVLACVFVVPFLVLIVTNGLFFPYITGKGFAFRVITGVAFGGWLLLLLTGNIPKPKISPIAISIGVFVSIVALADALGMAPFKSFWSNFERMDGFVTIAHMALYFLVAGSMLNTYKLWIRFWQVSLGVSIIVGLSALPELGKGITRIAGSTGNPIYLAVYMLFHIFIAMLLMRKTRNSVLQWVYGLSIPLNLMVLWFTGTRGALLGLISGLIVTALGIVFFGKDIHTWIKRSAIAGLIGVVLLSGGFFMIKDSDFVQNNTMLKRLADISLTTDAKEGGTGSLRLMVWGMAWEGFKEKPILGWGQENFNYVFNKYYNPGMDGAEPWYDRTHNILLDWLIAAGALGLLAYLAMYLVIFIESVRARYFDSVESSILTGLLAAYGVHNLFVFDHFISYALFFALVAWVYSVRNIESDEQTEPLEIKSLQKSEILQLGVITVIAVFTISAIYYINYPSYVQNKLIIKALSASGNPQTIDKARKYFLDASSYRAIGTQEAREQFIKAASGLANKKGVDKKDRKAFVNDAIAEMQEQLKLYPQDARFPHLIAGVLTSYGEYEKAVPFLEKALELSPTKISFLIALGSNAGVREDFDTAYKYYKKAVELAPNNEKAQKLLKIVESEINK